MKTRLVKPIGVRISLRRYWGDKDCPSCCGKGGAGYHNAHYHLEDRLIPDLFGRSMDEGSKYIGGQPPDSDPRWPTKCEHCPAIAPADAAHQVFVDRRYDSPGGELEPGSLYWQWWVHWSHEGIQRCLYWENCSDPRGHLACVLPNGHPWDIDARCSNCDKKDDKLHRCWVRHGDPEKGELVHVDKNGLTCNAGAGSIAVPGYHGFLHNGELTGC